MKNKVAVALFNTQHEAIEVVNELERLGFERDDISLVSPDEERLGAAGQPYAATTSYEGSILQNADRLDLRGIGATLIAGPLKQQFNTDSLQRDDFTDTNDRFTDRFIDGLHDLGVPDEDADTFAESVRRGNSLVAVSADDSRISNVVMIFENHGAIDIDRRAEAYKTAGHSKFDKNAPALNRDEMLAERERFGPGGEFAIPIIEESVHAKARKVDTGRVRIATHLTETPVEENVRLRDEHIDVERRNVDRPVSSDEFNAFQEGEVEFTESREEAVLEKEARVKEEVVVRRNVEEHQEKVRGTARKTEVDIDRK